MNISVVVSLIGILSVISTVYMGFDLWRKRQASSSVDVVSSAIELIKPYKAEVSELRIELTKANITIKELTGKLTSAESRANDLNKQLSQTQTEVSFLRVQVKLLSEQIRDVDGS